MDLVGHKRVGGQDVTVLEPTSRDSCRDHDDIPAWCLRRRLALAVHDSDFQRIGAEDRLCDWTNCESFSCAGAGDDAESLPRRSEVTNFFAVLLLQQCLNSEAERELDCLAGSAGRRDDDQPACWRLCRDEGRVVRREISVGYDAGHSRWKVHTSHRMRNGPVNSPSTGPSAMPSRDLVSAFVSFTLAVPFAFRIAVAVVAVVVAIIAVAATAPASAIFVAVVVALLIVIAAATVVVPRTVLVVIVTAPTVVIPRTVLVVIATAPTVVVPRTVLAVIATAPTVVVQPAVVAGVSAADDRHVAESITTRTLNDHVAVRVSGTALIDRVSVAVASDRIPRAIDTSASIVAAVGGVDAATTEDDVADRVGRLRVRAILTIS